MKYEHRKYHPLLFKECMDLYHSFLSPPAFLTNSMMFASSSRTHSYTIILNRSLFMGSRHHGLMNHSYNDIFAYDDEYFHNWVGHMRTALELDHLRKLRLPARVRQYSEEDIISTLGDDEIDRMIALRKPKRLPFIRAPYPYVKSLEIEAITDPDGKMSLAFITENTPEGYQMKRNLEDKLAPYQAV